MPAVMTILEFLMESGQRLFTYRINPDKITKIKQTIVSLSPIKNFLEEKGFLIESNLNPNLKYSTAPNFDLVARKQESNYPSYYPRI